MSARNTCKQVNLELDPRLMIVHLKKKILLTYIVWALRGMYTNHNIYTVLVINLYAFS